MAAAVLYLDIQQDAQQQWKMQDLLEPRMRTHMASLILCCTGSTFERTMEETQPLGERTNCGCICKRSQCLISHERANVVPLVRR